VSHAERLAGTKGTQIGPDHRDNLAKRRADRRGTARGVLRESTCDTENKYREGLIENVMPEKLRQLAPVKARAVTGLCFPLAESAPEKEGVSPEKVTATTVDHDVSAAERGVRHYLLGGLDPARW